MPRCLTFHSQSEADTQLFAAACANAVLDGLTIALNGELGSGKTHFVRAFCVALGVDASCINSPTFVLMQLYQGTTWPISHFDTYRLADPDEFLAVGADEFLQDRRRICLVEWADRVQELLPSDRLQVTISHTGTVSRQFEVTGTGTTSEQLVRRIVLPPQ